MIDIVIEYQGSRGMASEVVQEMQSGLEVWSSWQIHVSAQLANGKEFLVACIREPVEAANQFKESEAILMFQLFDFFRS